MLSFCKTLPFTLDNLIANGEFVESIAKFLDGKSLMKISLTSIKMNESFDNNRNWTQCCANHDFRQRSVTKTRGFQPWKEVYKSMLCIECNTVGFGTIIIDINGNQNIRNRVDGPNYSLISVCLECFNAVNNTPMTHRVKSCMMNTKMKLTSHQRTALLLKIPEKKIKRKRKRKRASASS